MTLPQIAELYLSERACTAPYVCQIRRLAGLVREPAAEAINGYLRARLGKVASTTVRNERTILLSLIKYAWERDILTKPVKGVMKVKARKPPTKAWTVEQLQAAIAATHEYGNRRLRSGVSVGQMLRSWLRSWATSPAAASATSGRSRPTTSTATRSAGCSTRPATAL